MSIDVQPATAAHWPDLEALFGERGACGGCWCLYFRLPRQQSSSQRGEANRQILKAMVESGQEPGLLAYVNGTVAGWVALGPRQDFALLETSRNLARLDEQPVWSVVCFFVAKPYRRQGMMLRLLKAASQYARSHGARILEGYPIDLEAPRYAGNKLSGAGGYEGVASVFRAAGFQEVKKAGAAQVMMRKTL